MRELPVDKTQTEIPVDKTQTEISSRFAGTNFFP